MRIVICGDSTAASYDPRESLHVGWGQLLGLYLPEAEVDNRAFPGRSTKSFLAEGRLRAAEEKLARGDLLLIQFAHNDWNEKPERHTEPWGDYTDNLKVFLETARRHGAAPVLLTPICMRVWENGALRPSHGEYPAAMRALARAEGVPLIEMYEESFRIVSALGEEASKTLFLHLSPGEDSRWPEGVTDNAHTRRAGAECFARFAAAELRMRFLSGA